MWAGGGGTLCFWGQQRAERSDGARQQLMGVGWGDGRGSRVERA